MKKYKRILCSVLVVFSMFFLSACCEQKASIEVKVDGSSEVSIKASINKDDVNLIKSIDPSSKIESESEGIISPLFEKTAKIFEKEGFEITPINNSIEIGFKADKTFISPADFNMEIKRLNKEKVVDSDLKLYFKKGVFYKRYMIKGKFKYVKDDLYEKMLSNLKRGKYETPDMSDVKLDLTVTLPGNIVNANSKRPVWISEYESDKYKEVYMESEITNNGVYIVAGLVGFVGLTFILIVIYRKIRIK